MISLTIAVLQIASPFILMGLMIYWVYRISCANKKCMKEIADLRKGEEILHQRITSTDDGLYRKIISVEEAVEELDDVVMDVLGNLGKREGIDKPTP